MKGGGPTLWNAFAICEMSMTSSARRVGSSHFGLKRHVLFRTFVFDPCVSMSMRDAPHQLIADLHGDLFT